MLWILEEKFIKVYQGLKEDNWILIRSSMTKKTLRNFVRFPNSVKKLQVCPTEQGRHPWHNHCMMSGGLAWTTRENTGATTQW